ncbi:MAG: DNA polymerase/3'-5' exonuclease PolX [Patescibacteria group bacterium]
MTNLEIAQLFRQMAAAYQILDENRFKIIAYERAADSLEHLTSEAKDLWDDGKLGEVPGIGKAIADHLDELFRNGRVKHWEAVMRKVPEAVFPLLSVPGIGPKKAYKLVRELKLKDAKTAIKDLEKAAKAGTIAPIEGFGERSQDVIYEGIGIFKKGQVKENRMPLPIADSIAQGVIDYLKKHQAARRVDALGSLRRQVATVGDIDIAVATSKPREIIDHFLAYPHQKVVEKGPSGATLLLTNGRQVDLRVQLPSAYGAMLQYFTGGKNHNIKLREYALDKGLSLSEYGIKNVKTGKIRKFSTEEDFYKALVLDYIPPELREDQGEIEAAKSGKLPGLLELKDIKGDLHIHTNYDLEPSHDLGKNTLAEHLDRAVALGYEYLGLSDHNPSIANHSSKQILEIMKRRKDKYEQQYNSWKVRVKKRVQILIMCEVDILPDGKLALPEEALEYVDAVIVSVHSSFTQEGRRMTTRLVKALESHPKVRILGHPTARLLGSREGVDANWNEVFAVCKKHNVALEINAYPNRLDLPDNLVFAARKEGLKFCVNTDAHAVEQMDLMPYGVSVARRGWAEKNDIVNTLEYNEFAKWLIKEAL